MRNAFLVTFSLVLVCLCLGIAALPDESGTSHGAPPFLAVTGVGATSRAPDMAVLSMGAMLQEQTAGAAQSKVNAATQTAISAIEALGVRRNAIRTTDLSLEAVYEEVRRPKDDEEPPRPPRLLGYKAELTLQVQLDDVQIAGKVIDAAIGAGINDLDGIVFGLRDDAPDRDIALGRAVASARRKAKAIAEAMGIELVEVLEITEDLEPRYNSGVSYFNAPEPTVIEPGEVTVETGVNVRYRIAMRKQP